MRHPGIADVARSAAPRQRGETAKAVVVKAEGADPTKDEIIAFAREHPARFKCPTSVDFVDVLPRNPSGKVLKKDLRAPYWADRERQVN
jgi:acyl-CoA synthetase (AMP-forming)/AMP-acid ligase II